MLYTPNGIAFWGSGKVLHSLTCISCSPVFWRFLFIKYSLGVMFIVNDGIFFDLSYSPLYLNGKGINECLKILLKAGRNIIYPINIAARAPLLSYLYINMGTN